MLGQEFISFFLCEILFSKSTSAILEDDSVAIRNIFVIFHKLLFLLLADRIVVKNERITPHSQATKVDNGFAIGMRGVIFNADTTDSLKMMAYVFKFIRCQSDHFH